MDFEIIRPNQFRPNLLSGFAFNNSMADGFWDRNGQKTLCAFISNSFIAAEFPDNIRQLILSGFACKINSRENCEFIFGLQFRI